MPDLGKYAVDVMLAYGATAILMAGLIFATYLQSKRAKAKLEAAEKDR